MTPLETDRAGFFILSATCGKLYLSWRTRIKCPSLTIHRS
jgi:hypothetical protein